MSVVLAILALLILGSAAVALALRNLVRSALLLVLSWLGIGLFFLWAGAEFLAFAQVLVYAGAISMVVLFAVLLTGRKTPADQSPAARVKFGPAAGAIVCALAVAAVIAAAVIRTPLPGGWPEAPGVSVEEIGKALAGPQAAALLVAGTLLTAALIGAIVVAAGSPENPSGRRDNP